jgi:hypothetical protein
MRVEEVAPEVDRNALLAGADFADAWRVAVNDADLDARKVAERLFTRNPRWIDALVRLRNTLVSPFGLKTSGQGEPAPGGIIGLFPVVSETPERLVAGFNDRHLDFRVVVDVGVDVRALERGRQVTLTTLVKTHNLLGRLYLFAVMPFHRIIARTLLQRASPSR